MNDEQFIRRCFDLARLGAGSVSPNPMVGAVLAHEGKIIGEGWHQRWGEAHAEVNCLRAVALENQHLVPYSTLFCNLEPCSHFGKTPPCADLILEKKIRRVVVSNTDPNPLVAGKGLAKLKAAGVDVVEGILEEEGRWLNRAFFTWITQGRPHVILKWAQTADGFLGKQGERTAISGPTALRLVHRWRAECDAILVGTTTAVLDNPRLDVRHYFGKNPLRIVLDTQGKIPASHHLLDDSTETWVFGPAQKLIAASGLYSPAHFSQTKTFPVEGEIPILQILEAMKNAHRATLLVEGGANVLNQFLDTGLWDEIRLLENPRHLGEGVAAPHIPANAILKEQFQIGEDVARIFAHSSF
ncbi:MAG: bifunctional diaminohydroxyphosphoribosylaminopyrimidine deaminase/5-amino-6-(5-phosphoribosylamino)uracil reductase RibD [Saprospiraceae bacterium]